ncbi:MAG: PorT family protein [Bacteroidales bacterium]|nr:PorT family protein [Bacteroidales bacterium]
MKKIILTIALAAVAAVCANAQIGVNVGYTSKNFTNVMNNEAGLFAGANYNIELVNGICVAPGVEFAMLNYTKDENNYQKENYLAVPIMFNYGLQLADGFKLVPYLGPTISFGLSSVIKGGASAWGITVTTGDVDMYDGTDYNKLDILIGGGVALDVMDMIRAFVGYNQGLLNRNNDADGSVIKTSGVNFGVAYLF